MTSESIEIERAKPGRWIAEGLRVALFLRPDYRGLHATPGLLGPAVFYWQALATGWLGPLITLWVCWIAARHGAAADTALPPQPAGTLFALLLALSWVVTAVAWLAYLMLQSVSDSPDLQAGLAWIAPAMTLWVLLAAARVLWRQTERARKPRSIVLAALAASTALSATAPAAPFWYADRSAGSDAYAPERYRLTQEDFEAQAQVFAQQTARVARQRAGVADVYAITVAPYASEDVFLRESDMVADVMRTQFDAEGRVLQLANQAHAKGRLPWATPLNVQRAIAVMAQVMDREEDILFIHLTSHGARDGKLSTSFWPLHVDDMTAVQLKQWLDGVGIRFRVVSVSACYSGTWLVPLRDEHTLVMTAADAEHTSYGCGRGSDLTYFGRAVFDEQLRRSPSFETAVAKARPIIEQREIQAGKSDGFSNPQIHVGQAIRQRLAALEARLAATASR
jgi:hypothetical protein